MPLSLKAENEYENGLDTVEKVSAWIASVTVGESAAVLKNICHNMATQSLREDINLAKIELRHVISALKSHGYID